MTKKSTSKNSSAKKRRANQRGNAMVDYLMITAVVAAVGAPIIMKFFGEPIRRSLLNNRGELVGYLSQDRKDPVPNAWFSAEEMPELADPTLNEPAEIDTAAIEDPDEIESRELEESNVNDPKNLKNPKVAEPKKLETGDLSAGGGGGGAGGGAARPSGFSASSSGGFGDDGGKNFFGSDGKKGRKPPTPGADPESGAQYGAAIGAGDDAIQLAESGGRRSGGKQKKAGDKEDSETSSNDTTRKTISQQGEIEEDRTGLAKPFNWWLLIKVLILILILLFGALIFMSSARRSG